jgi:hypothetical protein
MSVLANNFKMKFAGLLRGLLRRVDSSEQREPQSARPTFAHEPAPVAPPPVVAASPEPVVPPVPPAPKTIKSESMSELEMPLMPILEKLPPDIRSKWTLGGLDLTQANISISVEKVLPQLAVGVVKITFGELRTAAPDLFRTGEEYDSLPITLPLNDVLARLNPALLARSTGQRVVTAPAEITAPFGVGAQGVTFTSAAMKPSPPTTHFFKKTAPQESEPIKMPPSSPPVAPPPPAFASPSPSYGQRSVTPAAPSTASIPPRAIRPGPGQPSQAPAAVKPSIPFIKPATPPTRPLVPTPPAAAPQPPPPATSEVQTILAPLAALSESWPATLKLEISQMNLSNAQVALPVHLIEPALKRGRVTFPWHNLRSWIKPTPPGISIHDGLELELPLQVIAPLFLPRHKQPARPNGKASVPPSTIPNLFFGFPQPQPEEMVPPINVPAEAVPQVKPAEAKPVETNYYVWGDGAEAPREDQTDYIRPTTPATDFTSRKAMPSEIVDRATKLPGVVGVIIALPDGLKVAHHLPADLNPDTVAAFLPQLFSRVSQCAKELRMGELNNLNFTIGNIPWKIFRVNAVYFAAFGRAGEPLPTAHLAALAAELDRKK